MYETPYWPSRLTKYSINRLQGKSMYESAKDAGYTEAIANIAGARIEPQHNMRIKEALEGVGATNVLIAERLLEGLNAERADGSTDYRERREHAKLILEAKGELKTGNTVAIQVNIPASLAELWSADKEE
jgi:hypothetical protein